MNDIDNDSDDACTRIQYEYDAHENDSDERTKEMITISFVFIASSISFESYIYHHALP